VPATGARADHLRRTTHQVVRGGRAVKRLLRAVEPRMLAVCPYRIHSYTLVGSRKKKRDTRSRIPFVLVAM
jgi:hypothetical protein